MPTYEYLCSKCGQTFDLFQSIKEKPIKVCPKDRCQQKSWGKGKVKRAIGAGAGLIFKGTGFYITDYRSEQYKAAAKKESGGGGESKAGSAEGKKGAETKPAADSGAKPKPKSSDSSSK